MANKRLTVSDFKDIASEWSSKNDSLPNEVSANSKTKYFWVCKSCGSEWMACAINRCMARTGCPTCKASKRKAKYEHVTCVSN